MNKHYKKRISLLLILLTILLFNTANLNMKVAAHENTEESISKTNEVFTENYNVNRNFSDEINIETNSSKTEIIVSSPRPEKFQVWLNYNTSPIIIKPYDAKTNYNRSENYFQWTTNIKNINDNLISPKNFKTFSIYVKYKYSTKSFSKTFFCIDNEIRDFNLFTSNDIPDLSSQSIIEEDWVHDYLQVQKKYKFTDEILKKSHFPAVAQVGKTFYMLVFLNSDEECSIEIKGDNNYSYKLNDLKSNVKGYVQWIPDKTGNFKIIVTKKLKNYNIILEKKLYVNSSDGKYAQITNLDTNQSSKSVTATLSENFPKDNDKVQMRFTVSDPGVWTRTIKDYGQNYYGKKESVSISEGEKYFTRDKTYQESNNDQLYFHNGNYKVTSYIKYPNSIEYDDAKATIVNFQNCTKFKPMYLDLKYKKNKNEYSFTATAYEDSTHKIKYNSNSDLEYAFILRDCNGDKLVRNYESDNTWTWKLSEPLALGNYSVYVKARFKADNPNNNYNNNIHDENPLELPNSYEAIASIPIKNSRNPKNININYVLLNNQLAFYNDRSCNLSINDHTLYTIDVQPTNEKNTNLYKVYSVHQGVMRLLQGYSPNNLIPFYPQSEGNYKLIVLVKDVSSGAQETKKEIDLTVN